MNNGEESILKRVNDDELKSDERNPLWEKWFSQTAEREKSSSDFWSMPYCTDRQVTSVCSEITFIKHL